MTPAPGPGLRVEPLSAAHQIVAERCGYRLEGVMRSVELEPGLREDVQLWSLLPGDR